jgi:transposase
MSSKRSEWAARLRRFEDSPSTVAAFCRRERVSTASFYLWRRRLGSEPSPRFVPITIAPAHPAPAIEVAFPNGVVIRLPNGAAPLEALFALARGASC